MRAADPYISAGQPVPEGKTAISKPGVQTADPLSDDGGGVEISQGEEMQTHGWDVFYKAGSTMGSILLYTTKRNATIFPKRQLQEQDVLGKVMEMISTHMPPKKVNIR